MIERATAAGTWSGRQPLRIAQRAFCACYGAFFVFWGVVGLVGTIFGIGEPPEPPNARAAAMMDTVNGSFIGLLALASFVIGGAALVLRRTAPLGIVVLAPSVTFIFFYHLVLTGSVAWGSAWLLGLLLMAWWHRSAWRGLVAYEPDARPR